MFGLVREEGLGVMCYSPLAVGLLSGVYSPDEPPPADTLWAARQDEFSRQMRGETGQVILTLKRLAAELGKKHQHNLQWRGYFRIQKSPSPSVEATQ